MLSRYSISGVLESAYGWSSHLPTPHQSPSGLEEDKVTWHMAEGYKALMSGGGGAGRIDPRGSGREGQMAGIEYKSSTPFCRKGSQGGFWEKETGPFP